MRYFVYYHSGVIITDEYSELEINNNVHLNNIKDDLKRFNIRHANVYDENNKRIFSC